MNVMFLKGTQAEYDAAQKTAYTFYYTEDTHRLYLGEVLLASETAAIGRIDSTFEGTMATISSTYTPSGSISKIEHTPEGSVEVAVAALQEGETANYTPAGSVNTPGISITPEHATVNSLIGVGTLPTATFDAGELPSAKLNDGTLPSLEFNSGSFPVYSFNAGKMPQLNARISSNDDRKLELTWEPGETPALTTTKNGTLPSATFEAGALSTLTFDAGTKPALTFNAGTLPSYEAVSVLKNVSATLDEEITFQGTPVVIRGGFKGTKFSITPTFTGLQGTATASYTPEGKVIITLGNK